MYAIAYISRVLPQGSDGAFAHRRRRRKQVPCSIMGSALFLFAIVLISGTLVLPIPVLLIHAGMAISAAIMLLLTMR